MIVRMVHHGSFEEWLVHEVGVNVCEAEGFYLRRYKTNKICLQWGETVSMARQPLFPGWFMHNQTAVIVFGFCAQNVTEKQCA